MNKNKENNEMSDAELIKTLKDLKDTIYWTAIMKWRNSVLLTADSCLRTIDPFKNPTEMARTQGKILGIIFLENYINDICSNNNDDINIKY